MKNHRASCIKNSRGFSLIELIIVVAIMVALVAVLAPSYIKYVKKSRDAVVIQTAEDVAEFCKTEFADNSFSGTGRIRVGQGENGTLEITFEDNHLTYKGKTGDEARALFLEECGFQENKAVRSDLVYYITIDGTIITRPELETETTRENV